MRGNKELKLRDALQEHGAYWNVGSDRAWEEGSDVLVSNELFEALIELAAEASAENVRRFIEWLST